MVSDTLGGKFAGAEGRYRFISALKFGVENGYGAWVPRGNQMIYRRTQHGAVGHVEQGVWQSRFGTSAHCHVLAIPFCRWRLQVSFH